MNGLTALLYGLAVSISPCVLPLVPIVFRVIGERLGSIQYLLGSAISYAILGVAVFLVGIHFQSFMQTIPVKIIFSGMLLYLALSSFNLVRLPQWGMATKNPFLLGILAPIICSPCMTPALAAIIAVLDTSKLSGIYQLLFFGLGVNIPLILMCLGFKKLIGKLKKGNVGKYITWINSILLVGLIVYIWV